MIRLVEVFVEWDNGENFVTTTTIKKAIKLLQDIEEAEKFP